MREGVCFVVLLTSAASCVATSDANDGVEIRESVMDPYALAACTPMRFEDLVAKFAPGEVTAPLSTPFALASRTRKHCNALTGCSPWTNNAVQLQNSRAIVEPPRSGFATLVLDASAPISTSFDAPRTIPAPDRLRANISLELLAREPSPRVRAMSWSHIPPRVQFRCTAVAERGVADSLSCDATFEAYELDPFEFATSSDDSAYFLWDGHICTDGTYQLVTRLDPTELDGALDRNQMAIWGRL